MRGEFPKDIAQQGSPAEMPLRCHQSGLPRYRLLDSFMYVCGKESTSTSLGFLAGDIKNILGSSAGGTSSFLFGSLEDAPPFTDTGVHSLGFLSGTLYDLMVTTTPPAEASGESVGFQSGLLFNAVETADLSGAPESPSESIGFQSGTLFDVILVASPPAETPSEVVGFQTGSCTTVAVVQSKTESAGNNVGFLSGAIS